MMKKALLVLVLVVAITPKIFSQGCTVTESIPRDTIVCGESIFLTAFGRGQGIAILSENFNNGTYGPGWSATQQAMWNNPCSASGVDGTTHIWLGNSSPVPRILNTAVFNLSSCTNAGVTICFDMLMATQGNSSPCEGPDEPDEGIHLQYSTNGGGTWTDIHYFDPLGGYDPQFVSWNNWCFQVPAIALTATTQFRWFQDNDSGADFDHWGIDNVIIYCNDPTYNIVWTHDGYSAGPVGGTNPTPVTPHTTTSYVVVMSNGTVTCRDTVTVIVVNPTIVVNAGADTTVCNGQCARLNATAKIIQKPAKTPTYTNQETADITGTPGFPGIPPIIPAIPGSAFLNMDINITNLNQTTVTNGYITRVCISSLNMILFAGIEIFDIWLVCPSGDSILLVKDSTLIGTTLTNTCFVPAGSNIASSSSPYTGTFAPNQSFNNLAGCDANGVWSLRLNAVYGGITLPTGTFNSWSISFNDPEISYIGNFNWSPTTNMTNSTTLTPTVCPPPNTFTITVSDTAGCVTQSDAVNVNTQACCGLSATVARVQPTCGGSNGSINVTPVPAGSYSYSWNDGVTTQNRNSVPAGNYCVTITDANVPTCTFDTCITLNSNSTLSVSFTNPVNPTCAGNDGSITVNLSGGTAPYNVTVDTGGTPITFPPIPFPISQAVPGLPAGTVNVTVVDAGGCIATATATLTAPTNCCTHTVSAAMVQPTCGSTNGSISLTTANGSGNYSYAWAGGQTSSSITGVGAGTYPVTITDNGFANCFIDTTFSLSNPNAPNINNLVVTNETCSGNDGAVSVTVGGGTPPYSILWSGGQTSFSITNLSAGNYSFTVTDASSCAVTANTTVAATTGCCFLQISAAVVPPTCGLNNASITVNITTAGTLPYTYSLDGVNYQASAIFNNVTSGNYNVITLDANACSDTVAVVVPPSSNSLSVTITAVNISCFGANDGSATANVLGGNAPYTYIWSTSLTTSSLANLTAGNYSVSVTDQTGCSGSASATISEPASFSVVLSATNATCFDAPNGSIDAVVTGGTPGYFYLWSNNTVNQTAIGLIAGGYSVTVTDNSGCTVTGSAAISEPSQLTFLPLGIQVRCPGEQNGAIVITSITGGTSPYNYSATQDWANFVYATNDTIQGLVSGTYHVILSDNNGCTLVEDVFVPAPVPDNFVHTEDSTSCFGKDYTDGAIHIAGTTVQNMPYQFGVDGGGLGYSGDLYNLTGGNHSVTAVNYWGCVTQLNVIVPSPAEGVAQIFPGDTTIQLGESIQLFSTLTPPTSGAVTYIWSPVDGLSCSDCPNPVVYTYNRSTLYVLTITYNDLCKASTDVTVMVQSDPEIYIPNTFSPNGDGNNDKWMIYGEAMKVIDLKIFNRWGEKVYETNNVFEGWDGTYKGVLQNPAVFVYEAEITFLDDKKESRIGSIMLLR